MRWRPRHHSRTNDEARASLERAQQALDKTRNQRQDVELLADRLRAYREANHFAEAIAATMRRQP